MNLEEWIAEIKEYTTQIDVKEEGQHLWDNYQKVTAIMWRVQAIRSEIAWLEIMGQANPQEKKFRTLLLDPFIERLHDVATFESRKITAKQIEANLERV